MIIALVIYARAICRGWLLLVYGCMDVGVNVYSDVGASMFSSTKIGCKVFCVSFAVCTGVVGIKWRREAAVRYHAKGGPAGTP